MTETPYVMTEGRVHHTHSARAGSKTRRALACAAAAAFGGALAWRCARPRRVVVTGTSMAPALQPGDRLLVLKARRLAPGQVVAVEDPRQPERLLVKRVVAVGGDRVDVRGDNPAASTDSRHFGTVDARAIKGRAVYRYHPPGRARWWP
jgi:nickel-type superoxide dismutase maturation protease